MKRGFSLVETLIVVAVIGLLAAMLTAGIRSIRTNRAASEQAPNHFIERVKSDGYTIAFILTTENGDRYLLNREGGAPVKLP